MSSMLAVTFCPIQPPTTGILAKLSGRYRRASSDGSFTQPISLSGARVATVASPVGTAQYTPLTSVGMVTSRPAMSVMVRSVACAVDAPCCPLGA